MSHREESCLILLRQSEAIWSEITLHVYLLMTSARWDMEPALGDDFRHISTLKSLSCPFSLFYPNQTHPYSRILAKLSSL